MVDDKLACLFIGLRAQHRQHRPEDLVAIDRHVGGHLVEQCAADEKTVLIALQAQPAAIDDHLGAVLLALVDITLDAFLRCGGDDRAHLDTRLVILADLQRPHLWRQLRHKAVRRLVANRQHRRDRHAALAGRAIGRAHRRVDSLVHIGVGHDDHVVLRPAQRLHPLAVRTATRIDILADRRRADKADGTDIGMIENRVDSFLITMNDVEDTVGKSGFGQQAGQQHRRAGVALGRFQDEGVAAGKRHREHPHRHHRREIERGDPGHHADRLAHRETVDTTGNLRRVLALKRMRDAAGKFHNLDAARHLALGIVESLAMLR